MDISKRLLGLALLWLHISVIDFVMVQNCLMREYLVKCIAQYLLETKGKGIILKSDIIRGLEC